MAQRLLVDPQFWQKLLDRINESMQMFSSFYFSVDVHKFRLSAYLPSLIVNELRDAVECPIVAELGLFRRFRAAFL